MAFFPERAAEVQHREYAVLARFGTSAKAPRKVFKSLDCPDALPKRFFGEFLQFTLSIFESGEALKDKANRTLCNRFISAADKRRDKKEQDAERA